MALTRGGLPGAQFKVCNPLGCEEKLQIHHWPVHLIITMIKWIRTSANGGGLPGAQFKVCNPLGCEEKLQIHHWESPLKEQVPYPPLQGYLAHKKQPPPLGLP